MRFSRSDLEGVVIIEPETHSDERGSFTRIFCMREFMAQGLPSTFVQASLSSNRRKYTLRGLHFQMTPYEEDKIVRCTRGVIYDVVVDLRENSDTRRSWLGIELSAANRRAIFVPKGCAHGFLTLADDSEVLYDMTEFFEPAAAAGMRWNDPAVAIQWPAEPSVISERDRSYPDLSE